MSSSRSVLNHITQVMTDYTEQEHDLVSLAQLIIRHGKELTRSGEGILGGVVYDQAGNLMSCPCYTVDGDRPFMHDILSMGSVFRRCVETNSMIILNEEDIPSVNFPDRHVAIQNAVLVPLRFKGRPSGLIGLANRKGGYSEVEMQKLSPFFITVSNILSSFQLNEEILREKEEKVKLAESVADAKDSFLAKVSHEIRTPLNGIVGMTRVLLNMGLNQEVRLKINIINECSYQLISQVDDLLDYSKMTCGKLTLHPSPTCVRSCVEKAFDVIAAKASEKQITINSIVDTAVPAYVDVDSKRLRQILVNLLNNAVKFTEAGYIVVKVKELLPKPTGDSHRLQFDVEDSGVGIPKDEQKDIFNIFTQGTNSESTDGAGLGLAICTKLVELMNGNITVSSEPGRGSIFSFVVTVGAASMPQEDLPSFETSLQGMRALIVDDKILNQVVLCNMLQKWGMISVMCDSGSTALKYLQTGMTFDIGFIDIHMPQMNGYELSERIRATNTKYFPMIAVSSVDTWFSTADNKNFTMVLQKPLKQSMVYESILRVLHPTQSTQAGLRRQSVGSVSRKPLKILIAEDSDSNQKVIESQLQLLGYGDNITIVENGLQAVRQQKQHKYDVIFMDLKMPVMNGFDASRRIRKQFPSPKPVIVALSAMVLDKDKEHCVQCGMDHFIGKPIDMDELDKVMRTIANTQTK